MTIKHLNSQGLSYRDWHKEVNHLLVRNWNNSIAAINSDENTAIDWQNLWASDVNVGAAVQIGLGLKPNPLEVDMEFRDTFPGYDINQDFHQFAI